VGGREGGWKGKKAEKKKGGRADCRNEKERKAYSYRPSQTPWRRVLYKLKVSQS
jgi:hypothetical protein